MERGVEAGDGGNVRQNRADELERAKRLRLMERSQVGERFQPPQDPVVDPHRPDELVAAVHDAVADRVDRPAPFHRLAHRVRLGAAARHRQALRRHQRVVVEHRQLQAARTGVDDENAHVTDSLQLNRVSRR